jgi:AraC-like DNA-binding protein/mannose-6-phosphate isomerase-like protein (cupin superfamily)
MLRSAQRVIWEDAYSVIEAQINASAVHVWDFEESFPIDIRHFIMRREADIRMNRHNYFELLYLQSGEVTYEVAGEQHPMRPGDLFVMGGRPHRMSQYGRAQIRAVTLYFLPDLIRAHDPTGDDVQYLMPFLVQDVNFPHVIPANSGVPSQVRDLMGRIHAELPCHTTRSRLMVRTYLKMTLAVLVNHYAEFRDSEHVLTQRQRDLDRLRPVFDLIEARYSEEISVADAADAVHMSNSHFMRFFKQVTGQPFIAHLNQFRIAKAQFLLAATDRSIADIGHEVGFCNQSYFGLVFRRVTHLSPREYQMRPNEEVKGLAGIAAKPVRAKAG